MKTQYLILNVSSEHESGVAVVEWSVHDQAKMRFRLNQIEEWAKSGSEDLMGARFSYGLDVYEESTEVSDFIAEHGDITEWEDQYWVLVDAKPDFGDEKRVGASELHVSTGENFWWEIREKHTETTLESKCFCVGDEAVDGLLTET